MEIMFLYIYVNVLKEMHFCGNLFENLQDLAPGKTAAERHDEKERHSLWKISF